MFRFSISHLAVFLGKSPTTIRAWERKGMLKLPRVGTYRSLTIGEVQRVAETAYERGRISEARLIKITETLGCLYELESELQ